jgi:hypothetical protein
MELATTPSKRSAKPPNGHRNADLTVLLHPRGAKTEVALPRPLVVALLLLAACIADGTEWIWATTHPD